MFKGIKGRPAHQHWLEKWSEDDARLKQRSNDELADVWASSLEAVHEFWLFLLALCRRLQNDENPLTASDALHLGLIDEVIGLTGVPSLRRFVECARDPQ
jgi:hypothetical protein